MSVFKDFPGFENLEKNQGFSRTRKSPVLRYGDDTAEQWDRRKGGA